jgi:hypothetical protein
MRFFDALHHLHNGRVEVFPPADAAEHGVDHAGRAVNIEAVLHQPCNDLLNLRLRGALLHYDKHFVRLVFRIYDPVLLDAPHFINDALEDAFQSVGVQWAVVAGIDVLEYLGLALRLINGHAGFSFDAADFFDDARPFVEECNELAIDFINLLAASRERSEWVSGHRFNCLRYRGPVIYRRTTDSRLCGRSRSGAERFPRNSSTFEGSRSI